MAKNLCNHILCIIVGVIQSSNVRRKCAVVIIDLGWQIMTVIKFYFTRTIFDCRFFEEFENNLMKTVMILP